MMKEIHEQPKAVADTLNSVLKDGKISEAGNHKELLEKKGEYHKLYENQFAGIAT